MATDDTITCMYSCKVCGLRRVELVVKMRRPDEDVIKWIEGVQREMGADHAKRSPNCASPNADLMIPTTNTTYIGGPPTH